jgi:Zn-dependent M28 family amino/carboxypeptidase
MVSMPGRSHGGALPAASHEEQSLAVRLRHHVEELARTERNRDLERPAKYIESALASYGLTPLSRPFESGGRTVRNIEVIIGEDRSSAIVIGAHYDTVPGSPGANDNASGVAVLIELASLLARSPLPPSRAFRLVAFANEEPPYFLTREMGSFVWAQRAKDEGLPVLAMLSLEMLGYYRDAPGSQRLPFPLGFFYPGRADFIAFVGDLGSRPLVRSAIGAFRRHAAFPSEGVAAPSIIPGVTWSDHWSFRRHGFPAIMVTDTAFYRYPHYHLATDTPEKLDYERMARLTLGLRKMLDELIAR